MRSFFRGFARNRQTAQQPSLFDDDAAEYLLIRSRRKTLSVSIDNNKVIVRAPQRAPAAWIEEFLLQKQEWIELQLNREREQQANKIHLSNGLQFTLAGKPFTLLTKVDPTRKVARYSTQENSLQIALPDVTPDEKKYLLYRSFFRWMDKQALTELTGRTQQVAQQFGLDQRLGKINLRRTKSKWGHCAANGDIQYNPLIILAPETVIDYLVSHEVAHLLHRNHSKRFWNQVERMHPEYRQAEKWLKDEGYRLAIEIPVKAS